MAIYVKNYSDTIGYVHATWVEKVSNPEQEFLSYGRASIAATTINLDSQQHDFETQAQANVVSSVGFVIDTTLQDWTTMPLTLNSEFTDFPEAADPNRQLPKWWDLTNNFGADLVVKGDINQYVTSPSSVKFDFTGTGGNQGTASLRQTIALREALQSKGQYRLIFSFLSDDDSITLMPLVRFLNANGQCVAQQSFPSQEIGDSGGVWRIYDKGVTFAAVSEDAEYVQLWLMFKRLKDGAFELNFDSVDFHYGFDLDKPMVFPSNVFPELATVFGRSTEGDAHVEVTQGGKDKIKGQFDFGMIGQPQMERLHAAWAFMKGHRLNVETAIAHRAGVTMPKDFRFMWPGKFNRQASWSLENTFNVAIPFEEI